MANYKSAEHPPMTDTHPIGRPYRILLILLISLMFVPPINATSHSSPASEPYLSETAIEARAQNIGHSLRCMICQSQSIEDSDVDLAKDMRLLIRERVRAGESDEAILEYMQSRYGDFILLKPRMGIRTYLLWFGPFLFLLAAIIWFVRPKPTKNPP